MKTATRFTSVDAYIATFPRKIQSRLRELRKTIRQAAPEAEEGISYNMPSYKQNGPLVYFAAYEGHTGFYPTGAGMTAFAQELGDYETSKGTIRFPHDQPLPLGLVERIVVHRVNANATKKK